MGKSVFNQTQSWKFETPVEFFSNEKGKWVKGAVMQACINGHIKVLTEGQNIEFDVLCICEIKENKNA